ncbi:ectin-like [Crassostrea virginica]
MEIKPGQGLVPIQVLLMVDVSVKVIPFNGGWGSWSQWSAQCSVTCGQGVRTRDRQCANPPPAHGGAACVGDALDSQTCQQPDCRVDGILSVWGDWTPCSVTCGSGSRVRSRACIPPQNGGQDCHGLTYEMSKCSTSPCTSKSHPLFLYFPPFPSFSLKITMHCSLTFSTTNIYYKATQYHSNRLV